MKSIGLPNGSANLIKPPRVLSVDFAEVLVASEKVKNVGKFSPPDDKKAGISGNQDLLHSDHYNCLMNRLDFCKESNS